MADVPLGPRPCPAQTPTQPSRSSSVRYVASRAGRRTRGAHTEDLQKRYYSSHWNRLVHDEPPSCATTRVLPIGSWRIRGIRRLAQLRGDAQQRGEASRAIAVVGRLPRSKASAAARLVEELVLLLHPGGRDLHRLSSLPLVAPERLSSVAHLREIQAARAMAGPDCCALGRLDLRRPTGRHTSSKEKRG